MPFLWAALPTPGAPTGSQVPSLRSSQNQAVAPRNENSPIQIWADHRQANNKDQTLIADGHVVVFYGDERIDADHVEAHFAPDEMRAFATGNVLLTDPDGTVRARDLEISWKPTNRYAKAVDVTLTIAGATLTARTAFLTPQLWTFDDFTFTTDTKRPPLYEVHGRTIWIYPGHSARVLRPSVYLFGSHILTWPVQRINLDPRTTGLRPPAPDYHSGIWGVDWITGTLISRQASVEWHFDAFKGSWPGSGIHLNRSFVAAKNSPGLIEPRTERDQRFDYGFLETVLVPNAQSEVDYLDRHRSTLSAQTDYNAAVAGRGADNETFSYPILGIYEYSNKLGQFGFLGGFRFGQTRRLRDEVKTRGQFENSLELPRAVFSPDLTLYSRIDSEVIEGADSFVWARTSSGLVYEPEKWLAFSGGLVAAAQTGTPDYDIDPLVYKNGFTLRADYHRGPRRLSLMTRYDTKFAWFDEEVLFTQAMGPLEGYLTYREYPHDFRFGVLLRIDQVEDVLKRRSFANVLGPNPGNSGANGKQ